MITRPTASKRTLFFLLFDFIISSITLYGAYLLRFNFLIEAQFLEPFLVVLGTIYGLKVFAFFIFKIYFVAWRFFGFAEGLNLLKAHIVAYGIFVVLYYIFPDVFNPLPRSALIIDFFLSLTSIGLLRISKRILFESSKTKVNPTLIIGANHRATTIIKGFLNKELDYYPVAIVDDNRKFINTYLSNVKVYDFAQMEALIIKHEIRSVIITKNYTSTELNTLFEKLYGLGIEKIKLAPLVGEKETTLKDISIEDLLARKPKDLDTSVVETLIQRKRVLVTGAGGSIGSEICRQCVKFGASELIMVDNSEYNLYQINEELRSLHVKPVMVSVIYLEELKKVFTKYTPQIVIHAAAYKHVPLCEDNPHAAVVNNILGTKNVIDLSLTCKAEKVVLISTDKAVRPTNVMGATKRVCELYAQNVVTNDTEIVAVRFGNVLGSSGSVIPKFKQLLAQNKPLSVTHPEITRYFMLIPEACQLVLQAAAIAKEKELFILDMGKPIKIVELAKKMLQLYGKEELGIEYTGLRPGEKLYEELLIDLHDQKTQYFAQI